MATQNTGSTVHSRMWCFSGWYTNHEDIWACAERDWSRRSRRSWCWTSATV